MTAIEMFSLMFAILVLAAVAGTGGYFLGYSDGHRAAGTPPEGTA